MKLQSTIKFGSILTISLILFVGSIYPSSIMGHQRQLITIGDTDILFRVASLNEPVFVDDKSGVDMFAYTPDPSDPTNFKANKTKPLIGLESMLKVEISADGKNKTLNFEASSSEPGHYKAHFIPTLPTTYTYKIFGNVNGTNLNTEFTCTPAGAETEVKSDNSTINLSDNVVRKAIGGSFDCPIPAEDQGFPEPYVPSNEVQKLLTNSSNTLPVG